MASENLVNDLFEIIQTNSKEKLSYEDFEKDLLKSINLPNDEVDRALSIMLSQAEVNPNIIGETRGGTFIVSPSFSASVISTIKYENQFIEGKNENNNVKNNSFEIAGIILTPVVIDSMINNYDKLTFEECGTLFSNYEKLSKEQQRELNKAQTKRMKALKESVKNSEDESLKEAADVLEKAAEAVESKASQFDEEGIDQEEQRALMLQLPGFKEYLRDVKNIELNPTTHITQELVDIYFGYLGQNLVKVGASVDAYNNCDKMLKKEDFGELEAYFFRDPNAAYICSVFDHTYEQVENGTVEVSSLSAEQRLMHDKFKKFKQYLIENGIEMPFNPRNRTASIEEKHQNWYTFTGCVEPKIAKFYEYVRKGQGIFSVKGSVKDIEPTSLQIQRVLDGVSSGLLECGVDEIDVSEGLNQYSSMLDSISVEAENEVMFSDVEPEEWGTIENETASERNGSYDIIFKNKLLEERDKIRKINPIKSDVLDVMAGITYGGTIQERMKDADSLKVFSHEVSHSVKEIDKKIEKGIPLDRKPDLEIDKLMEAFMRTHAEDLIVGEMPIEKVQPEERSPENNETPVATFVEEQIAVEPQTEQTFEEVVDGKDDIAEDSEDLKKVEDKDVKKPGIFSPSDFGQVMDVFSTLRTSQYVSMFEDVKTPLMESEPKKIPDNKNNQNRTDDDEPIQ